MIGYLSGPFLHGGLMPDFHHHNVNEVIHEQSNNNQNGIINTPVAVMI